MKRRSKLASQASLAAILLFTPTTVAQPFPLGEEFQINSYTKGDQRSADVAMSPDGSFVVVWTSEGSTGSDTDSPSIQARRFDATDQPAGDEFQVNVTTAGDQRSPHLGSNPQGRFVVTWGTPNFPAYTDWTGRVFDHDGTPATDEFGLNSASATGEPASIAMLSSGTFVISEGNPGLPMDPVPVVYSRSYDSQGQYLTSALHPGTDQFLDRRASVVQQTSNDTLVARHRQDGLFVDRVDSGGSLVGTPLFIGPTTLSTFRNSWIAAAPDGRFAVAWATTTSEDIRARIFSPSGTPLSPEVVANPGSIAADFPAIGIAAGGDFLVTWQESPTGLPRRILGTHLRSDGERIGSVFQVNTGTSSAFAPHVASSGEHFLVAWTTFDSVVGDIDGYGIRAIRLASPITLFHDAFEPANFSGWDDVVP